ncbi:Transketolase family protein [Rhodotorula toruloides ATCC 204091]|uniref:Transketolase family protein n=1 Tax=Rhodotorula toruloides TaxID=5286 RepID=A0A0K3CHW9_RHOTO|nr:Transketolase family protein [Rhodotorula toruloides ATCC 204091]KAK4332645.1 Transketolase family protein [Rhodotorula toruloides]PRQ74067.1 transketolase family protein [Rhodotorula toruloides]
MISGGAAYRPADVGNLNISPALPTLRPFQMSPPGYPNATETSAPSPPSSGPAKKVYEFFNLTGPKVAERAQKSVNYFKKLGHPVYSPVSHSINV